MLLFIEPGGTDGLPARGLSDRCSVFVVHGTILVKLQGGHCAKSLDGRGITFTFFNENRIKIGQLARRLAC